MAVVSMKKLSLSLVNEIRGRVFQDLQTAGCVHLQNVMPDSTEIQTPYNSIDLDDLETEEYLSQLEDVIEFLESQQTKQKMGILDSLAATAPEARMQDMTDLYLRFPLEPVLKDIRSIEQSYKDTDNRITALRKEQGDLQIWAEVGMDLDTIHGKNPFTGGMTGYIPHDSLMSFTSEIKAVSPFLEVLPAYSTANEVFLYIVYAKSEEEIVRDKIKEMGFAGVAVSERNGDLAEVLEGITSEIVKLQNRLELYRIMIVDYQEHLDTFKNLHDYLLVHQQGLEGQSQGVSTESVSFYEGWVPQTHEKEVIALLQAYPELDYTLTEPTEEEYDDVPVLLETRPVFKPFEPLTRMFGLPVYGKSADPTAHLSPFYFIFYGFCLGDFFYGLIMLSLFGFLARKSKNNPGTAAFMTMLALAGLSSLLFGILFGSYFGNLFTEYINIPFLKNAGLINTLERPMLVLYISLIMGAIHLMYGLFVNLIFQMKKSVKESLWDNGSWIVFLAGGFAWATLAWIGGMVKIQSPHFWVPSPQATSVLLIIVAAGGGLIVLNSIRKALAKGPLGIITGFLGGLWELYGATGYLSDLLSYARLLALGLATGVIANVFNFLALDMGMPIYLGIVILFIGHAFNLVLSAFGAFVHSLRLQFVEFFSKFMEAGGKEFRPLRREGLYNNITKD